MVGSQSPCYRCALWCGEMRVTPLASKIAGSGHDAIAWQGKTLHSGSPARHLSNICLALSILCSPQKHALAALFYMQTYTYMPTRKRSGRASD